MTTVVQTVRTPYRPPEGAVSWEYKRFTVRDLQRAVVARWTLREIAVRLGRHAAFLAPYVDQLVALIGPKAVIWTFTGGPYPHEEWRALVSDPTPTDDAPLWVAQFELYTEIYPDEGVYRALAIRYIPEQQLLELRVVVHTTTDSSDKFRPKGTDEVGACTGADGELHGGDGNSQEVDHASASDNPDAKGTEDSRADGDRSESGLLDASEGHQSADDASEVASPSGSLAEHECEEHEATEGGTQSTPATCQQDETPQCDAGVHDSPDSETGADNEPKGRTPTEDRGSEESADRETGEAPGQGNVPESDPARSDAPEDDSEPAERAVRTPRRGNGGWYLDESVPHVLETKQAAHEIRRAFEHLLSAIDIGGTEDSPRIDPRRLAREIIGKSWRLQRASRRELMRGIVVVAVDASGSCSACCNDLYGLAVEMAKDGRIILLRHSNGELDGEDDFAQLDEAISKIAKTQKVQAVVNFGDWDAGKELQAIAESGVPLYWMDSYCAKDGAKPASAKLRAPARDWRVQPAAWWQGVSKATSAAIAMRSIGRKDKSH